MRIKTLTHVTERGKTKVIPYEVIQNDDPIEQRKLLKERLKQRKIAVRKKGFTCGSI